MRTELREAAESSLKQTLIAIFIASSVEKKRAEENKTYQNIKLKYLDRVKYCY